MKTLRIALPILCGALLATEPNAATKRWWSHVRALAGDDLAGRDTGSEGYRKAAAYVVKQFEAAGLTPGGEDGGWYQSVPLHSVRLRTDLSEIALVKHDGVAQKLKWLQQTTVPARMGLPEEIDAPLVFDSSGQAAGNEGKILVRIGRGGGAAARGAMGTLTIDATGGPEPARWPVAYSVAMTLRDSALAAPGPAGLAFRFNPAYAEELFAGSGHSYKEIADLMAAGKPLPRFDLPVRLRARLKFEVRT